MYGRPRWTARRSTPRRAPLSTRRRCRRWESLARVCRFAGKNARRVESKLEKMRHGGLMRRPVAWIQSGSDVWFGLAAGLTNAITTVALARFIGGKKLGDVEWRSRQ